MVAARASGLTPPPIFFDKDTGLAIGHTDTGLSLDGSRVA
jgi:hypothetical protein